MILIVTTISVYLFVYHGVEMADHSDPEQSKRRFRRKKSTNPAPEPSAGPGPEPRAPGWLHQPLLRNSTTRLRAS